MHPFRRATAFGPVSRRQRRDADLFFAELMGRAGTRSSGSRLNAERFFADLAGEEVAGAFESPPVVEAETLDAEQAPTVTPGRDKDEIIVTRADNTRFHVRRKVRAQILTKPGRPRIGFCSNDERVFFRLSWCEGTQGTIDAGANPQGAFKQLLDKVINQINRGEGPDQVKETLENASVQAFVEVDIANIKDSWKIKGDVKLEINRTGIATTTAKVSADRGWINVGLEYRDDGTGKQVLVKGEVPLFGRKISGKECPVRELAVWWDVECLREVPATYTIKAPAGGIEHRERLFLYFEFANDRLRSDPKGRAATPAEEVTEILRSDPKIGTARLNKRQLERLDYLVGQGYWVRSVDGYASPEGPREKYNEALSKRRAEKVRKIIQERYRPNLMRMRFSSGMPPVMRFPAGQRMPQAVGKSENPILNKLVGGELEGDALDRALILGHKDLKPYLTENKDELARMTVEDQNFVTDKSKSIRKRAERLFQNLRRVEIELRRIEPLRGGSIKLYDLEHVHNCPDDLIEAAEREWGSRVPFTKPDPPLCN